MGMNETPSAERVHVAFFGRRNVGKSSVVNKVTGQDLAVVSDVKGTTTDPVQKAMELLPLGPVVIIDTPGFDDEGELGELRMKKTRQILNKTDVAVLVVDATEGMCGTDEELVRLFTAKGIRYLIAYNKCDLLPNVNHTQGTEMEAPQDLQVASDANHPLAMGMEAPQDLQAAPDTVRPLAAEREVSQAPRVFVSARTGEGIFELKERIAALAVPEENGRRIVGDLLAPSDFVVLVVPIDKAAPKGRLILPQQQTIRDILDSDATAIVVKENELAGTLACLGKKPRMVITDSQVFAQVSKDTPEDILLTSFSILFARYKGDLALTVRGAAALDHLRDGDKVLISEGCTHHRQCDDIGTVKIPRWLAEHTGRDLSLEWSSGTEFPENLAQYRLIIHCGGCMLNEREMKYRQKCAQDAGVPITNYGIAIAHMNGILRRSLQPFSDILRELHPDEQNAHR